MIPKKETSYLRQKKYMRTILGITMTRTPLSIIRRNLIDPSVAA